MQVLLIFIQDEILNFFLTSDNSLGDFLAF